MAHIVAHASSLGERLQGALGADAGTDNALAERRWASWCLAAARGDGERFARRLAWDHLDAARVRAVLGATPTCDVTRLPEWAGLLRRALARARPGRRRSRPRPDAEVPFEELCRPFVEAAAAMLRAAAGPAHGLLSARAHEALARQLVRQLSRVSTPTFHHEFSAFVASRRSPIARRLRARSAASTVAPSRRSYAAFVAELLDDGLGPFFREYCVLARLLATASLCWVDATGRMLRHLAADRPTLAAHFGAAGAKGRRATLGRVVSVVPGLSDPHDGGRTVVALTFASGLRLVYKPKDIGMEAAYADFLAWVNHAASADEAPPIPLAPLRVLRRPTHGWVEWVAPAGCVDADAARRYHERAGMIACLMYVLGATDLHHENLIAAGEHPCLIDLETLMHPEVRGDAQRWKTPEGSAPVAAYRSFWSSSLRSGLLGRWTTWSGSRVPRDMSGFGDAPDPGVERRLSTWRDVNTDGMTRVVRAVRSAASPNVPTLDGRPLSLGAHADALLRGFRRMYELLLRHRSALTADGPLAAFAGLPVRFVFRPTRVYGHLLDRLTAPAFLRDGCDRSIELDVLSRAFAAEDAPNPFWRVRTVEDEALGRLDVPLFTGRSDSTALTLPPASSAATTDVVVPDCFDGTSFARTIDRIARLNEEDLHDQLALLEATIHCRLGTDTSVDADPGPDPCAPDAAPWPPDAGIRRAIAIADELERRAIRAADGTVTWIGLTYVPGAQRMQVLPLRCNLYDGSCGVAVFLAALAAVTGEARYAALATATLSPLRRWFAQPGFAEALVRQVGIGGAVGVGSAIYGMTRVATLSGDAGLLAEALAVARALSPMSIAADEHADVVSGAAGAILSLLPLYQATAERDVLGRARLCGERLLASRVASPYGCRVWATTSERLLTGFAHGAAGIAYALLRLYEATREEAFREAAAEAIAYEARCFRSDVGNWPDLRTSGDVRSLACRCAWCHGATGIGLARLGGLAMLDTATTRRDLEAGLAATLAHPIVDLDSLCCGNLGRAELLLAASARPEYAHLGPRAAEIGARVARRAPNGARPAGTRQPAFYDPGLFQGAAGVGYELLRLARPRLVPSVLLWE